jgi:hypothetical protein
LLPLLCTPFIGSSSQSPDHHAACRFPPAGHFGDGLFDTEIEWFLLEDQLS